MARYVLISPLRAGASPLARYQQGLEEAATELTDGIPDDIPRPGETVLQAKIGGLLSLVASEVEAGDGESLGKMLPNLTELFLGAFLDHANAGRVAEKAI